MREMTTEEARLLELLSAHKGRENAIRGSKLARELRHSMGGMLQHQQTNGSWQRKLRKLVNNLIFEFGIPIIGDHSRGYYMVESIDELDAVTNTLQKHALHELWKVSRLKKIAPAELLGQLTFEFDDGVGADMPGIAEAERMPTHLATITALLEKYAGNPEQYAAEIRKLQKRFAPMFLSHEDVVKLKEAQGAIGGILERVF